MPAAALVLSLALALHTGPLAAQPDKLAEARILLEQSDRAYETDLRRSAAFAERALALAERGDDRVLERRIAVRLCMSLTGFAADRALAMAEARLRVAERGNDRLAVAGFLICKAYAVDASGDMASAVSLYERALRAAQSSGDRRTIAEAYAYRGENRHFQGRYDEAIADLDRAYALYSALGDATGRRYTLNAMANLYSDPHVGEFDRAIEYYRQLLAIEQPEDAKGAIATTLFNIASAYEEKGDYSAALRDFRRALELDRGSGERDAVAEGERAIGRVLVAQGKAEEALPMIDRALAYFAEKGNADAQARTRITRAGALRELGRLDEAMRTIDLSLAHFEQAKNPRYLVFVHQARAEILATRGDWRAAYLEAKTLREVENRLEKSLMQERTSRLRVQFDAARKDEENSVLQAENQRRTAELDSARRARNLQRLVIVLGGALLMLLGVMALQQLRRNRRMSSLAMTDDLTDLPNRRHILYYLDKQRLAASEADRRLSIVAFDIDHFKRINDDYGHGGGDRVLSAVASVVSPFLRTSDRIGRIGGEEFLVVLPDTALQDAQTIAERLRSTIERAIWQGFPSEARVTASFGVAERHAEDLGAEALLKRADDALYRAKREGRNRVVSAD